MATTPDDAPRLVAWYRPEIARRLRRVLLPAAGLMLLGSLAWAHVKLFHGGPDVLGRAAPPAQGTPLPPAPLPPAEAFGLMAIGLVLCVAGGLLAILGLLRTMREDVYLALRTDGALWHRGGDEVFLPWGELERVRWDAEQAALVFERRDGDAPFQLGGRFADVEGPELARRLDDVRRKAIWGLL